MKTRQKHTWYESDLHLYNNEFLIEIILDLLEDKKEARRISYTKN